MHFEFALELSDIDLWNIDLLDTHLDWLSPDKYTDIPSKYFVCLDNVFKTSSRRLGRGKIVTLKTCWRRLQDQQMFAGLVLASKLKEQHPLKMMFKVNSETRCVTMNSKNLQDYFHFTELEMPETIDEISESILTDENTVIVVDNRNAIINFED